jgi:phosphate transport system substrate-binding protein
MKKHTVFFGVLLLIVSAVSSLAQTQDQQATIRVSGADSMFYRVKLLGKLFQKIHPLVNIDVSQGGTMDSGIRAVINGEADVALASCSVNEGEDKLAVSKGVKLVERLIGYGGITIIANVSAGVERLTLDEVKKIFEGQITNWKEVRGTDTPIKVIRTDETHPGTLAFLQRDFMKAPFIAQATVVSSFPGVVATVADSPGSIGYARIREITESPVVRNNPRVKVISLGRSQSAVPVYPSRETVLDHSYPLLRPYFIYYSTTAKTPAVQFADFLVKKGWGTQDL